MRKIDLRKISQEDNYNIVNELISPLFSNN